MEAWRGRLGSRVIFWKNGCRCLKWRVWPVVVTKDEALGGWEGDVLVSFWAEFGGILWTVE